MLLRNPRREVEVPGPTTVQALLVRLDINPESVLVIVGDELVTHDAAARRHRRRGDPPGHLGRCAVKCRTCRGPAVVDIRRHNAAFCREHFLHHCEEQVRRAISSHRMIAPDDRILVAVSGGKDSLALWDVLLSARLPGRRPLPRPRHRRVLRRVGHLRASLRRGARAAPRRGRPRRRPRVQRARRGRRHPPRAVRRMWICRNVISSTPRRSTVATT